MPSPLLSRAIYTYEDCAELLRVMEAFCAADRNNPHSDDRPHCNTICEAQHDVDQQCLLCRVEGALADVRCLIGQHEIAQRKSPCGCPYHGQTPSYSWIAHTPACRAEMAMEAAERRRPA